MSNLPMIPQTDPKASYLAQREAIDAAMKRALEGGYYILGSEVKRFEEEFARWSNVGHCIGVANGTDAIELALRSCGIGRGDSVFTVSHTAVATVVGIERSGATPVMVDIDPQTYTLSPLSLQAAIDAVMSDGGKPAAVLAVHLYGHPADVDAITPICQRYGMQLIEDCAQAHGAMINGRRAGSIGAAASFSFYPTKNLGAIGDGGAVTTNSAQNAERCRMLREYGWKQRYISDIPGCNSRLDELQAAILHAKLANLDAANERRRQLAQRYTQSFSGRGLALPLERPDCRHVYHQYVVRSRQRDALREFLKERSVGTLIHYPTPVHLQPAYSTRFKQWVPMEQTEKAAREVISLPMFPELSDHQVERVIGALLEWKE